MLSIRSASPVYPRLSQGKTSNQNTKEPDQNVKVSDENFKASDRNIKTIYRNVDISDQRSSPLSANFSLATMPSTALTATAYSLKER